MKRIQLSYTNKEQFLSYRIPQIDIKAEIINGKNFDSKALLQYGRTARNGLQFVNIIVHRVQVDHRWKAI